MSVDLVKWSAAVDYCSDSDRPLILGCDANSHHTLWGSTNVNKYGVELTEYLANTDLEILNRGNEHTFVTEARSEVLEVTFASIVIVDEETLSDHKEITFNFHMNPQISSEIQGEQTGMCLKHT